VPNAVTYAQVIEPAAAALQVEGLITSVSPLDLYQAEHSDTKNITIRISVTSYEKTMTNEEVTALMNTVIETVLKATDGKVI
jgi:phenylalanyl-tRNA synthetase beta subunit